MQYLHPAPLRTIYPCLRTYLLLFGEFLRLSKLQACLTICSVSLHGFLVGGQGEHALIVEHLSRPSLRLHIW